MATNFPSSLDSYINPAAGNFLNNPSHSAQHDNENDAIVALETKVGVDSSAVTSTLDYKLKNAASSNPGHKHTLAQGATDVTASPAELNFSVGVTSAIQTQINGKQATLTLPLTVPNGGSGVATLAAHGVLIGAGTSVIAVTGAGSAGQVLTSNGASADPTFQAAAGVPIYKNGSTTYDTATASGNQNIAHGLGVTPKFIRITVTFEGAGSNLHIISIGTYNGTTNSMVYMGAGASSSTIIGNSNSLIAWAGADASSNFVTASATFNSTNIILAWTKTGTPTSNAYILWEAVA